ncbi:unnamed protein product [Caenorhabditis auriculariae]|uniref:Uncharacterized protein n=1 Tax=Caenorhabditis auriculariae TaxID=2777116 RepID=A0A8S1H7Z7_9PELO|nr:unnamed protein product [Caenorhabditis auriculariae]
MISLYGYPRRRNLTQSLRIWKTYALDRLLSDRHAIFPNALICLLEKRLQVSADIRFSVKCDKMRKKAGDGSADRSAASEDVVGRTGVSYRVQAFFGALSPFIFILPMLWWSLILLPVAFAQRPSEASENAESFRQLYGIATKIMEISGNIMGQNGAGNGGGYDGELRPRFQGVRSFNEDNSVTSGQSSSDRFASMARLFSEYGGMLTGGVAPTTTTTTTTTAPPPSGFQSLLNTFLGSSQPTADIDALPPPPTPRPRARSNSLLNLFGDGSFGGGNANIQKPSEGGVGNIFGNFFGLMPTTTTTTTEAPPVQKIINMFVPQTQQSARSSSGLGNLNFMELFGVAPRTTTTAQPPLQALFNPRKAYSGGPEDIDGIVNALMRSNARPASQEPSSFLSQFLGGKK